MNKILCVIIGISIVVFCEGCATAITKTRINPGKYKSYDYVFKVKSAYLDKQGNVVVCVFGRPADAIGPFRGLRDFTLRLPITEHDHLKIGYYKLIPKYNVTIRDVGKRCPEKNTDFRQIPVHVVQTRTFGSEHYSGMSEKKLADFIRHKAVAPAIYQFQYTLTGGTSQWFRIVYIQKSARTKSPRAIEIYTARRAVKPRPGYRLLLPFAVVFDVITAPVQLLVVWSRTK